MRFTDEVNETQRSRYAVSKDGYKAPKHHIARHAELNQPIVLAGTCQNDCMRARITAKAASKSPKKTKFTLENNSAGSYCHTLDYSTIKGTIK